jgi:hypothetical protein
VCRVTAYRQFVGVSIQAKGLPRSTYVSLTPEGALPYQQAQGWMIEVRHMMHRGKSGLMCRALVVSILGAFLGVILGAILGAVSAQAQECPKDQLATVVDQAGEKLRRLNTETQPRIDAAMRQLKTKRGWSDADYEEKAYEALQDDRVTAFDTSANELLAKMDTLSGSGAGAVVPCERITEVEAASLELQATIRAKTKYVLGRLETLAAQSSSADGAATPEAKSSSAVKPPVTVETPAVKSAPKAVEAKPSGWSTSTAQVPQSSTQPVPPPPVAAVAPTLPRDALILPSDAERERGYTIEEIQAASEGALGKVSAGIGGLLEHAFRKSGRPSAYIIGQEGGGAFLAGLRYGKGTLYLRSGGSMPIYWHGPSVGTDFGASGSKTMFLIYRLNDPDDLIASFTGIDGSAYVVGGLGLTFMSNGRIQLAPIRSGIGLRLGANIGYVRFTRTPTWNPF